MSAADPIMGYEYAAAAGERAISDGLLIWKARLPNKLTSQLSFEKYDLRLNSLEEVNLRTAISLLTK